MHTELEHVEVASIELNPGFKFYQEPYLINGNKTNLYWVEIDKEKAKFKLQTFLNPKPMINVVNDFANDGSKSIVVGINTNQFFLSDSLRTPKSYSYNLYVKNGLPFQLPSNFRATLIANKTGINIKNLNATGTINIGNKQYVWHGYHIKDNIEKSIQVFGIFQVDYIRSVQGKKKVFTGINSMFINCENDEILVGVGLRDQNIIVENISNNGLSLFDYLYILKGSRSLLSEVKHNDLVTNLIVDTHVFKSGEDAVSLVSELPKKRNHLRTVLKQHLTSRNGKSYPVLNHKYRKSWCLILEKDSKLIFFINDARPLIAKQSGLNIYELQTLLLEKFNYDRAYICDAGQSSKIVIWKNGSKLKTVGNLHYLNYQGTKPVWDGYNGRYIPSVLLAFA